MVTPVVLFAAYDEASKHFCVEVIVDGVEYRQAFEPRQFANVMGLAETSGLYVGTLRFRYAMFNKRDVTIRMKRGIKHYFRSVWNGYICE